MWYRWDARVHTWCCDWLAHPQKPSQKGWGRAGCCPELQFVLFGPHDEHTPQRKQEGYTITERWYSFKKKKKSSTENLNSSVIVTKLVKVFIALAMCNYEILQMKKPNLNNPCNLRQIQSTCSHILRRK